MRRFGSGYVRCPLLSRLVVAVSKIDSRKQASEIAETKARRGETDDVGENGEKDEGLWRGRSIFVVWFWSLKIFSRDLEVDCEVLDTRV